MWKPIEQTSEMYNFEANPVLEGTYLSTETNKGSKQNSSIHHMQVNGEEVTFWGSTVLDNKLHEVAQNYSKPKIRITYNGMKKGQTANYKDFTVEIWDEVPTIKTDEEEKVDLSTIPF